MPLVAPCPHPCLGDEVRVHRHDARQLLRVAQAHGRVEGKGRVPRGRREAPRAAQIARHGCQGCGNCSYRWDLQQSWRNAGALRFVVSTPRTCAHVVCQNPCNIHNRYRASALPAMQLTDRSPFPLRLSKLVLMPHSLSGAPLLCLKHLQY